MQNAIDMVQNFAIIVLAIAFITHIKSKHLRKS